MTESRERAPYELKSSPAETFLAELNSRKFKKDVEGVMEQLGFLCNGAPDVESDNRVTFKGERYDGTKVTIVFEKGAKYESPKEAELKEQIKQALYKIYDEEIIKSEEETEEDFKTGYKPRENVHVPYGYFSGFDNSRVETILKNAGIDTSNLIIETKADEVDDKSSRHLIKGYTVRIYDKETLIFEGFYENPAGEVLY